MKLYLKTLLKQLLIMIRLHKELISKCSNTLYQSNEFIKKDSKNKYCNSSNCILKCRKCTETINIYD